MNILVTGAQGFIGKNLCASLKNLRDGKDPGRPGLSIGQVFSCDRNTDPALLEEFCSKADFVFHLAGVNRPQSEEEFLQSNWGLTAQLLALLRKHRNRCPVMLASSIQASLPNPYGQSKLAAEEALFAHGRETGADVLVYRFPNVFGKWCRPNYNSVVATFCHNMARELPIQVSDPAAPLTLAYIDDVVAELLKALEGKPCREGRFCTLPITHRVTLGEIVALLERFKAQPETLCMPPIPAGSFAKKLYSTYLSYLPKEKVAFPLKMHCDARGSFTELLKTMDCGQFSVNISKPGITKGQHWHHSKWELFMVVSGHGRIQMRQLDTQAVLNFDVSGDKIEAVHMLPGYTHSILNLSETENLVTLMWASEPLDAQHPDTFFEVVE